MPARVSRPAGVAPPASRRTGREPLGSSGSHQAHTPVERLVCLSHASKSSCFQLPRSCDRLTRPLRSSPITGLRRSYESVRPSAPHRYARLAVFAAWASPFTSERLVPAVPRDSLHPLHAPSTPIAVRAVIRHPADSSQVNHTLLVSTTLKFLTTRLRRVHFRSSLGCSPARVVLALFLQRSPPWLFTTAAWRWFETCS